MSVYLVFGGVPHRSNIGVDMNYAKWAFVCSVLALVLAAGSSAAQLGVGSVYSRAMNSFAAQSHRLYVDLLCPSQQPDPESMTANCQRTAPSDGSGLSDGNYVDMACVTDQGDQANLQVAECIRTVKDGAIVNNLPVTTPQVGYPTQRSDSLSDYQYQQRLETFVECIVKRELNRAVGNLPTFFGYCTAP